MKEMKAMPYLFLLGFFGFAMGMGINFYMKMPILGLGLSAAAAATLLTVRVGMTELATIKVNTGHASDELTSFIGRSSWTIPLMAVIVLLCLAGLWGQSVSRDSSRAEAVG